MASSRSSPRSRWRAAPPPETFAKWQLMIIEKIEALGLDRVEAMFIYMVADQAGDEKPFFVEELDIPGMSRAGVVASILHLRRREVLLPVVGEFSTAFRFTPPWRWLPYEIETFARVDLFEVALAYYRSARPGKS
jgi:hypothetical protein